MSFQITAQVWAANDRLIEARRVLIEALKKFMPLSSSKEDASNYQEAHQDYEAAKLALRTAEVAASALASSGGARAAIRTDRGGAPPLRQELAPRATGLPSQPGVKELKARRSRTKEVGFSDESPKPAPPPEGP